MLKSSLIDLIKERESERKKVIDEIDAELAETAKQEKSFSDQVDRALDTGEVTESTALAELNLRAQRRKAERLQKEKESYRGEPLFSIQETKDLLEEVNKTYREEWACILDQLRELKKELSDILEAAEAESADHAACARELKAAIERSGYKVQPYNGAGAAAKVPQYNLSPNDEPNYWKREHIEKAIAEIDELLKG